jgi:hypothetical protein
VCVCVCVCVCMCHRERMRALTSSTSLCVLVVTKEHVAISIGTQTVFGVIFCHWLFFLHDLQSSISTVIAFFLPCLLVPLLWSQYVFTLYMHVCLFSFVTFLLCFSLFPCLLAKVISGFLSLLKSEIIFHYVRIYSSTVFVSLISTSLTPSNNYLLVTLFWFSYHWWCKTITDEVTRIDTDDVIRIVTNKVARIITDEVTHIVTSEITRIFTADITSHWWSNTYWHWWSNTYCHWWNNAHCTDTVTSTVTDEVTYCHSWNDTYYHWCSNTYCISQYFNQHCVSYSLPLMVCPFLPTVVYPMFCVTSSIADEVPWILSHNISFRTIFCAPCYLLTPVSFRNISLPTASVYWCSLMS